MKFRKKPVVIEAIQWNGENQIELGLFMNVLTLETMMDKAYIQTLEGTMTATVGDWIIKGVKGEFYPCKPDIFESTYELVIE